MNNFLTSFATAVLGALLIAFVLLLGYLITASLTYVICYCFGWQWSWLIALGVYFVIILIRWTFHSNSERNR